MGIILLFAVFAQSELNARPLSMGGCFVSFANDPSALYYNPGGLTNLEGKSLILSIRKSSRGLLGYPFIGYGQGIGEEMAIGVGAYRDDGILAGIERDISSLSIGMGIGLEKGEEYYPLLSMGFLLSPLEFKNMPGNICPGLSLFYSKPQTILHWGLKYQYRETKLLFEIDKEKGMPLGFHTGAFYSFTDFSPEINIMGGLSYKENFSFSLGFGLDFQDIRVELGYGKGEFLLSTLFRIGRREERRIAEIYAQFKEKEYSTAQAYLSQGKRLYNETRYGDALNAFDLSLLWDPTNKEAQHWYNRVEREENLRRINRLLLSGRKYYKEHNYVDAIAVFDSILKIDSTNTEVLSYKRKSLKEFSLYISEDPKYNPDVDTLFKKGLRSYSIGDYSSALKHWREIKRYNPESKRADEYIHRTKLRIAERIASGLEVINKYEKEKRWRKALLECNRLLKLAPKNERLLKEKTYIQKEIEKLVKYHLQLGISRFERGALWEAEKEFAIVLLYYPKNQEAKSYMEKIRKRTKREDAERLYMAGIEAYTKGEYELSIKLWEKVLEIKPDYPNAKKNIERAKRKLKLLGG